MHNSFLKTFLKPVLIVLIMIIYAACAFSFSRHTAFYNMYKFGSNSKVSYEQAKVTAINSQEVKSDPRNKGLLIGSQNITVHMLTGSYKGRSIIITNGINQNTNYKLAVGQTVIVTVNSTANAIAAYIYVPNREPFIYLLIGLFILLLCLVGGKKGVRSVIGIFFTLVSVLFVFVPLLYRGVPAVPAVILLCTVTTFVTLLLIGGVNAKTFVAVLGTMVGVIVSAGMLFIFQKLMCLSGYTMGEAGSLLTVSANSNLQIGGLMFAAVIISSLGAVMDMAISVASSANEVYEANTNISAKASFLSYMNVGRDMMGTMANTLILVFTGSSLNLLILIYTYNMQYVQVINSNEITTEIVEALIGSIGAILTVPIVAFTAAKLLPLFYRYGMIKKVNAKTDDTAGV